VAATPPLRAAREAASGIVLASPVAGCYSAASVAVRNDDEAKARDGIMGFLRRLFGGGDPPPRSERAYAPAGGRAMSADEQAVERYRYMLRTAPPEAIEEAHAEAFARLTPEQRRLALQELGNAVPPHERGGASDDPRSLARLATRAEMRQPGTLERAFGGGGMGMGGGIGMGGMIAGGLLASIAGSFIGTAIAQEFFDNDPGFNDPGMGDELGTDTLGVEDPGLGDAGLDLGSDFGGDVGGFEG
jgi:hypothetical protein